jgi:hypothetical protein
MLEGMLGKQMIRIIVPKVKDLIKNLLDGAKKFPLMEDESTVVAMFMNLEEQPYLLLVTLCKEGITIKRVLQKININDYVENPNFIKSLENQL